MVPENADEVLEQAVQDAVDNGGNFECLFSLSSKTNRAKTDHLSPSYSGSCPYGERGNRRTSDRIPYCGRAHCHFCSWGYNVICFPLSIPNSCCEPE